MTLTSTGKGCLWLAASFASAVLTSWESLRAIDLLRTADGAYVFLEVNPAGEWRFVEERTGQPMTAAMAALLTRLHQEGSDER